MCESRPTVGHDELDESSGKCKGKGRGRPGAKGAAQDVRWEEDEEEEHWQDVKKTVVRMMMSEEEDEEE